MDKTDEKLNQQIKDQQSISWINRSKVKIKIYIKRSRVGSTDQNRDQNIQSLINKSKVRLIDQQIKSYIKRSKFGSTDQLRCNILDAT